MTIKNYSKQCLMISAGIMVLALLLSLFGMGINVGIDFSGGMSMQYTMGEAVTQSDIEGVLNLSLIHIWWQWQSLRLRPSSSGA